MTENLQIKQNFVDFWNDLL